MTNSKFGQEFWEQLWSKTLEDQADKVAGRSANAHLIGAASALRPGRALDAGCGHGADALWLAAHGWRVTAVDFSPAALAHGRGMAKAAGPEIGGRIEWSEADLSTWTPEPRQYDLVLCLYVHVAGSVEGMVRRMAEGVAPGGTLFLVGHRPIDPMTGTATAAANQVQISVEDVIAALDSKVWEFVVAEERSRAVAGAGVDAVICARCHAEAR